MARAVFGPENGRVQLFRVAAQAGVSFERQAAVMPVGKGAPSPFVLAQQLAKRWRQVIEDNPTNAEKGVELFDHYLAIEQDQTKHATHAEALKAIRDDLRALFSLEDRLHRISARAHERARDCVHTWGSEPARSRLAHVVPLAIDVSPLFNKGRTTLEYNRRAHDRADLRIGSVQHAIWDFLTLEFSLFHEHLSHQFPGWTHDDRVLSEAYLFAAEFAWFQAAAEPLSFQCVGQVWNSRLASARADLQAGQWFLHRCGGPSCFSGFLLDWVAQWDRLGSGTNRNLKTLLEGVFNSSRSRPDSSDTELSILQMFESIFCVTCNTRRWDIAEITSKLEVLLDRFGPWNS